MNFALYSFRFSLFLVFVAVTITSTSRRERESSWTIKLKCMKMFRSVIFFFPTSLVSLIFSSVIFSRLSTNKQMRENVSGLPEPQCEMSKIENSSLVLLRACVRSERLHKIEHKINSLISGILFRIVLRRDAKKKNQRKPPTNCDECMCVCRPRRRHQCHFTCAQISTKCYFSIHLQQNT